MPDETPTPGSPSPLVADPQPQRGFHIRWPIYVLWVLTSLAHAAGALVSSDPVMSSPDEQAGYRMGRLIGAFIVPPLVALIPSLLVFFIARRSTSALNISLMVMFILLLLVGCMSVVGHLMPAPA